MAVAAVSQTKQAPKFPTIPVPAADLDALHRSVLALKQAVEMLTGGDGRSVSGASADRYAPHVFVQPNTPTPLHQGDLWLCTGTTYTFNIWKDDKWLIVATLPPV